jgi:hypothetical protein
MKIAAKVNQYAKNGSIIFVYTVQGTDAELETYKTSQGNYFRTNDAGAPLYFSQRICNEGAELQLTKSGRYTVLQDLERTVVERESATNTSYGKLEAIRLFTGLTKAQLSERLLQSF